MEYSDIVVLIQKVVFLHEKCEHKGELWEQIARCTTDEPNTKIRLSQRVRLWYAAASIAVLISIVLGIQSTRQVFTVSEGEQAITLPDNTQTTLYAGSTLRYNRFIWLFRHDISLSGKARFAGEHGNRFCVRTSQGRIAVLGTEFLVTEQTGSLQVACFSGSVRVTTPLGEQVLNGGEQVFCNESGMQFSTIREELPEYILFEDKSFGEVIRQIEDIYDIRIDGAGRYAGYIYSGVIPTGNLREALELILKSCNIGYSVTDKEVIIH